MSACAAIWGFEEPLPLLPLEDGAVADGRSADCVAEKADEAIGTFVAAAGTDGPDCGTMSSPCQTIGRALERASVLSKKKVYVGGSATYVESVALPAGVELEGGWDAAKRGSTWQWGHACASAPGTLVTIRGAPDKPATVTAADLKSPSAITDVTIESRATELAAPGDSMFAVVARGEGTQLTLTDVIAIAHDGKDGATGAGGDAGAPGGTGCAPDNGGSAATKGDPGAPAGAGGFDENGYDAGHGTSGKPGFAGQAGPKGSDPGCLNCFTCAGALCANQSSGTRCGSPGTPGCGGGAGGGGEGGGGGGSSIALFAWNARVTVVRGTLHSGNGGNGGEGGTAGPGGPGAAGGAGAGITCDIGCKNDNVVGCASSGSDTRPGGVGGDGGAGSAGGAGGGGGGGFTYAVYQGGTSARVDVDPKTQVIAGTPGHGTGGAPDGVGGQKGP